MNQAGSRSKPHALRMALIYGVLAAVWILVSDSLVMMLAGASGNAHDLQRYKGLLFVAVTSCLLYVVLRYAFRHVTETEGLDISHRRVDALWPWVLFILMGLVVAATGWLLFSQHRSEMQREKQHELAAIADLKVGQIGNWLAERRADAAMLRNSQFLADAVELWMRRGHPAGLEQSLIFNRLDAMRQAYAYAGVALLDQSAQPLLVSGEVPPLGFDEQSMAYEAMARGEVVVADFHRSEGGAEGKIELDLIAPLLSSQSGRPVGAVYLRLDPDHFLFPLVQTWPVPSRSAESFLVEREGDYLLHLSELRFQQNSSLKLAMPLQPDLPVGGILAARDITEGLDYQGRPVLAAMRPVPGSPWYLVAKIDVDEVYAPIHGLAQMTAVLVMLLIAVSGIVARLWWRRQQSDFEAETYRAKLENQALSRHFEFLSRFANDIILLSDDAGRIMECNDRAEQAYGYSRDELLGMSTLDLVAERSKNQFSLQWRDESWENGAIFETWFRRGDGTEFPAEVSARLIKVDGNVFRQGIVREITERKESEEKLRRVTNLYATLSATNHAITHVTGEGALFARICAIAVERGHFRFAWVGMTDPESNWVSILAHAGDDQGYFATLKVSVEETRPEGQGPTGTAIREGRIYVVNDYGADSHTRPWQAAMAQRNIRSAASLPLFREGVSVGAFTVYAEELDFFQPDVVKLLQEMTHDVSFALDNMANEARRRAAEEALKLSEERFRAIFDSVSDAIFIHDLDSGAIVDVNRRMCEMYGYTHEEALLHEVADFSSNEPPYTQKEAIRWLSKVIQGEPQTFEWRARRKDGALFWVEIGMRRATLAGIERLLVSVRDISERMEILEKLRLDAKVFEESGEGIIVTDAVGNIIAVNRAFTDITGYSENEVIGRNPSLLKSGRHDDNFFVDMWAMLAETGHWVGEMWDRRRNGEIFPVWQAISAAANDQGEVTNYISVFTDISASKASEERIRHLSQYDALTDLPNQALLMDHIDLAISQARRTARFVAVMAINLERFRNTNERFGHSFGDQVLQTIAIRMRALLRDEDTVSRIGADNFVVLVADFGEQQQVSVVAAKILEAIAEPIVVGEIEVILKARVGIAIYPKDGEGAEALLKNADVALARSGGAGSDSYIYYTHEQSKELEELLAIEQDLRLGIQRGELRLHYQPRVDLISGEVVSMEALVRWQHPHKGLLFPDSFIHVAEQSGLILPLGKWVLWEACRQLKAWRDAGHVQLKVSVNVSAVQFHQSNLPLLVSETLSATGLPSSCLELEVTESLLMQDADLTVDILHHIKETGIAFSIDDFGTGYSSLAYLKAFPIDTLKVDKTFIRDIVLDAADAAIVQGTISLAHSLKLKVVAEGVETEAQMSYLRSIHCDEIQGYFYSRPLPPAEMLSLIRANRRLQDISCQGETSRKLLLVDDEPNITSSLNRLLRREGYTILVAQGGREALELLGVNHDVGVVVSDQRMPGMTGTELMSQVKMLHPEMIRIILSGYTDLASVTDAINRGEIYKFLTKPWDDEQLKTVIRDAFLRFELAREERSRTLGGES